MRKIPPPDKPVEQPNPWGLTDILAIPDDPKRDPVTRVFEAKGREWPITVDPDALEGADAFYEYSTRLSAYIVNRETLTVQPPMAKAFTIKSPTYLASLELLSRVAVPRLTIDEWAMFGQKMGVGLMEQIFGWVATTTGMSQQNLKQELDEAKKGKRKATSPRGSSKRASSASATSHAARSKASSDQT